MPPDNCEHAAASVGRQTANRFGEFLTDRFSSDAE
jgi:hypothetical protein